MCHLMATIASCYGRLTATVTTVASTTTTTAVKKVAAVEKVAAMKQVAAVEAVATPTTATYSAAVATTTAATAAVTRIVDLNINLNTDKLQYDDDRLFISDRIMPFLAFYITIRTQ
jgi:hypothetical protein